MGFRALRYLFLFCCLLNTACGTMWSQYLTINERRYRENGPVIYGGARIDVYVAVSAILDYGRPSSGAIPIGMLPLSIIDFPVSAVADTVILPITITEVAVHKINKKEDNEKDEDQDIHTDLSLHNIDIMTPPPPPPPPEPIKETEEIIILKSEVKDIPKAFNTISSLKISSIMSMNKEKIIVVVPKGKITKKDLLNSIRKNAQK